MENKQIIPVMLLEDGRAGEWHIEDPIEAALYMDKCHADGVLIRDMTTKDHHQEEKLIKLVQEHFRTGRYSSLRERGLYEI